MLVTQTSLAKSRQNKKTVPYNIGVTFVVRLEKAMNAYESTVASMHADMPL